MTTLPALLLLSAVAATAGSLFACMPGFHVYNLAALLLLAIPTHAVVPPECYVAITGGLLAGYVMGGIVPAVLLAAPDESAVFVVQPAQKYVLRGRGTEAVLLTATGAILALLTLSIVLPLTAGLVLPALHAILSGHHGWILWCVITFMLLSEWPRPLPGTAPGPRALAQAWRSLGAGILTFLLAGAVGFLLMHHTFVRTEVAFQQLMPAFVGLFTLPGLVMNLITHVTPPKQTADLSSKMHNHRLQTADHSSRVWGPGLVAGLLGGGFAAFFPGITGGVGGFLAGHATTMRDDRAFLISQGANRSTYYIGGLMLFFIPGLHLTRGGAAWMLQTVYRPDQPGALYLLIGMVACGTIVAILLLPPLVATAHTTVCRFGYRAVSMAAGTGALLLVLLTTGSAGLAICAVCTAIGLLPLLYGSRRMNCLGVILLPLAINMTGHAPALRSWLGL